MNTSLLVVYTCTVLIIFLPYFWFIVIGNKNKKKQQQFFDKIVKDKGLSLSVKEQWNKSLIGVDETKHVLLFIKYAEDDTITKCHHLSEIKECSVQVKSQNLKVENKTVNKLQNVTVLLQLFENNQKVTLNFYDTNDLFDEDLDVYRAEKWKSIIENILPKTRHYKRFAS